MQQQNKNKGRRVKMKVAVVKEESRNFLQIGTESIEVSDYSLKSSADGSTELSVTIKGNVNVFETSANLTT